ncbi:hypothetical protein POTOM_039701 [Populus tomentosa]|uniref:YTH domain-containing family protein n=1 Tax=Populus tomentosa TaxID=118781 RepID=A0A8X8CJA8_POPTO|nr:hypothetical protein POTOM_039701 [Populus tomentosa]
MVAIPMSKSISNVLEGYASFTGLVTRDWYLKCLGFMSCFFLTLLLCVMMGVTCYCATDSIGYMDSLDVKELQNFQDCSNLRLLLWVRIVLFPSLWISTPESFRGISLADTQWNWNAPFEACTSMFLMFHVLSVVVFWLRVKLYFIVKSCNLENLELSVQQGVWATQRSNEPKLNEAFDSAENVILIFSVNRTRHFQGCYMAYLVSSCMKLLLSALSEITKWFQLPSPFD